MYFVIINEYDKTVAISHVSKLVLHYELLELYKFRISRFQNE